MQSLSLDAVSKDEYFQTRYGKHFSGNREMAKEICDSFLKSGEAVSKIKGVRDCFLYAGNAGNTFRYVIKKCGMPIRVSVVKEEVYLINTAMFNDTEIALLNGPGCRS